MPDTINLFQEHLTCKACEHSWEGFLHGFCRGHSVLQKEARVLFVPDDIVSAFQSDFDFTYPELFLERGGVTSNPVLNVTLRGLPASVIIRQREWTFLVSTSTRRIWFGHMASGVFLTRGSKRLCEGCGICCSQPLTCEPTSDSAVVRPRITTCA